MCRFLKGLLFGVGPFFVSFLTGIYSKVLRLTIGNWLRKLARSTSQAHKHPSQNKQTWLPKKGYFSS
jgi:hypothetical protein